MIHLCVIQRGEGGDDGYTKCLRSTNQPARQNAPSALRVANAYGSRKAIDRDGEIDAMLQNFARQSVWNLDATRTPIMPVATIGYVGPAFEKHASPVLLFDDVQSAFQTHEILPGFGFFAR